MKKAFILVAAILSCIFLASSLTSFTFYNGDNPYIHYSLSLYPQIDIYIDGIIIAFGVTTLILSITLILLCWLTYIFMSKKLSIFVLINYLILFILQVSTLSIPNFLIIIGTIMAVIHLTILFKTPPVLVSTNTTSRVMVTNENTNIVSKYKTLAELEEAFDLNIITQEYYLAEKKRLLQERNNLK